MSRIGAFSLVLQAHLTYTHRESDWLPAEDDLVALTVSTYLPLLICLYDLREEGIPFQLTLGLSPLLAEQLSKPQFPDRLEQYISARLVLAERDHRYYAGQSVQLTPFIADDRPAVVIPQADPHLSHLAMQSLHHLVTLREAFIERFNRDIIGALKSLQDTGHLELMTTAATHAYLPLLATPGSLRAQVRAAISAHERLFGQPPRTFWLPECGYRPGIERVLRENACEVFLCETHAITGGEPVGVAAGETFGVFGDIGRLYAMPPRPVAPARAHTTFNAYRVGDVAVIGRDNPTVMQVSGLKLGYPGDFDYCEYFRRSGTSGLRYWRVTGEGVDLTAKEPYYPEWAACKVEQHAEHFAHMVHDQLRQNHEQTGGYGVVLACFDADLFGGRWAEGVQWLRQVFLHLARSPQIDMTTPARYVAAHPPTEPITLPESSRGTGGEHFVWNNGENYWMWQPLHDAEHRMARLAEHYPDSDEITRFVLNQAARELLYAQSSDWWQLLTTGAKAHGTGNFARHLERFSRLAHSVEVGEPDITSARRYFDIGELLPDMDYRWFAP